MATSHSSETEGILSIHAQGLNKGVYFLRPIEVKWWFFTKIFTRYHSVGCMSKRILWISFPIRPSNRICSINGSFQNIWTHLFRIDYDAMEIVLESWFKMLLNGLGKV